MTEMTPRERLHLALSHQEPDRVPLHYRCSEPGLRRLVDEADLDPDVRRRITQGDVDVVTFAGSRNDQTFKPYHADTPPEAEINEWGAGSLRHPDSGENLLTYQLYYPLKDAVSIEDLEAYPWPAMADPDRWGHINDSVAKSHAEGRPVIGQMSQTIVELAYSLRPMAQLFIDFYENPDFVRRLFSKIAEARCFQARIFAQAGVDVLRIGDDLGSQQDLIVSPDTYREWIKPYHARVIATARAIRPEIPVLYHSDGNIEAMVLDLLDIGVTAINPVQPECMDPAEVKDRWGDRLTVWGAAGSQGTLAFGSEDDVRAEVAERMATVAPGGGYVAGFINVVWSPTARMNVLRYLLAIQEMGVY